MHTFLLSTIAVGFQSNFNSAQFLISVPPLIILIGFKLYLNKRFKDFPYCDAHPDPSGIDKPSEPVHHHSRHYPDVNQDSHQRHSHHVHNHDYTHTTTGPHYATEKPLPLPPPSPFPVKDDHVALNEHKDASLHKLQNRYQHPALTVKLFAPMVHARMVPLLRQIYQGEISLPEDLTRSAAGGHKITRWKGVNRRVKAGEKEKEKEVGYAKSSSGQRVSAVTSQRDMEANNVLEGIGIDAVEEVSLRVVSFIITSTLCVCVIHFGNLDFISRLTCLFLIIGPARI